MKVVLYGAARTVTGSCFMVEAGDLRFGVDCGMHQGNKEMEKRNFNTAAYLKPKVDFFLVTHAHIDHSGLLPRMVAEGFAGPIYCTEPTAALLEIMLLDSAHIQEMEAEWDNRKLTRKGSKQRIEPLYTAEDAANACKMLRTVTYDQPFEPAPGVRVTYRDAGHILGASFVEVEVRESAAGSTIGEAGANGAAINSGADNETTKLIFSGDLGRPDALLLNDPARPQSRADYLFLESTYGDRDHKNLDNSRQELAEAISHCQRRGGKLVIPAFAVERTQEVIYTLFQLSKAGKLPPDMPVFVDSPLAIRATEIFRKYRAFTDQETRDLLAQGEDPLSLPNLRYTLTSDESKAINNYTGPAIIISASGMCNAGRIKHHLRHNIWNPNAAIVFVGYQGVGTPGRKIVDGAKSINLFGEELGIKAKIFTINGFSAHAGQNEILEWVGKFASPDMNVLLVHGEINKQEALAALLREKFQLPVYIPGYLEELDLTSGRAFAARETQAAPGSGTTQAALVAKAMLTDQAIRVAQIGTGNLPEVDWEALLAEGSDRLSGIQRQFAALQGLPWEDQVELRDNMLEINDRLRAFLSRVRNY
ncbi:MAG: MBL fold metallo-hydrolase [Deltaproteobacteria bacterium]|jgi:metallo-beta-lactamase family protein|nr:MBL fold metallo-hydrolase [Deltaproteobacteria bacterium]